MAAIDISSVVNVISKTVKMSKNRDISASQSNTMEKYLVGKASLQISKDENKARAEKKKKSHRLVHAGFDSVTSKRKR